MLAAQADYTAIILCQSSFHLFMALFLCLRYFFIIYLTGNCNIHPHLKIYKECKAMEWEMQPL